MEHRLCIIKPNKSAYSETFIQSHIDRLSGEKIVLYGGAFPLYNHQHKFLIKSKADLFSYLIQKKFLKRMRIPVRNRALSRYLKEQGIQIVLAEYGFVGALVAEACAHAGIPLIIHFHGADAHHRATVSKYKAFYQEAFDYATAIVVVSGDMSQALLNLGAKKDKVFLNPYGVDLEQYQVQNVTETEPRFLSVGRFVEKKAPLQTIKAFRKVVQEIPSAHLTMVGDGPLLEQSKLLVKKFGIDANVTFAGILSHDKIISLMGITRCFVLHSVTTKDGDMEGTPNVILEASAAGLPVVSTLHAGIKEAVVHGNTGFLVKEHDYESMALWMIKLACDPFLSAELGLNGRNHMLSNYNMSNQIEKLDRLIQGAINGFE